VARQLQSFISRKVQIMTTNEPKLKLTLKKSMICRNKEQRKIVKSMGLNKIGQSVVMPDTAATRGIIQKIGFMLDVENL